MSVASLVWEPVLGSPHLQKASPADPQLPHPITSVQLEAGEAWLALHFQGLGSKASRDLEQVNGQLCRLRGAPLPADIALRAALRDSQALVTVNGPLLSSCAARLNQVLRGDCGWQATQVASPPWRRRALPGCPGHHVQEMPPVPVRSSSLGR